MAEVQDCPAIQLLHCIVDEDDESYLRFSFNENSIKYITIGPGVFANDDMCFGPAITKMLPTLPIGDWNYGYIAKDSQTGKPYFAEAYRKQLEGVQHTWHPTIVDHLELNFLARIRFDNIYEVTTPKLPNSCVYKFATFEHQIGQFEKECAAYEWVDGHKIAPNFLGYVREEGRIIGFLMEKVANARFATPSDLEICSKALEKLHVLGIVHGDINKHNFLINDAGVTLIDLETAYRSDNKDAFRAEKDSLWEHLNDKSGKGSCYQVDDDGNPILDNEGNRIP